QGDIAIPGQYLSQVQVVGCLGEVRASQGGRGQVAGGRVRRVDFQRVARGADGAGARREGEVVAVDVRDDTRVTHRLIRVADRVKDRPGGGGQGCVAGGGRDGAEARGAGLLGQHDEAVGVDVEVAGAGARDVGDAGDVDLRGGRVGVGRVDDDVAGARRD